MVQKRVWGIVAGLLAVVLAQVGQVQADTPPIAYVDLKYQLVRKGLDKNYVNQVFADSRNSFLPDVVRKIAYLRKETKDIYKKFLTPQVAARGRAYMQEHRQELDQAAARFGVAPEVIVGILTVESDLGNATGRYPVFNVFASLAVMDTPEVIREVGLDPSLQGRLHKKAAWAQRELQIFLEYCRAKRLDPYSYRVLGRGHGVLPVSPLQPEKQRRRWRRRRPRGSLHPCGCHFQHCLLLAQKRFQPAKPLHLAPGRL